ncbi:MAG: ydfJ1, partial [Oerskovia sp.]|nr:ydfJ1 [Oerskovia sp.]
MIARVVTRSPRLVVTLAALLLVALGAVAAGTLDALSLNRYEAPGSESVAARSALADLGTGTPNVALLVEAPGRTIDDPVVARAATTLARDLAALPGVGDVRSAWSPGSPSTLASEDRTSGLVLAWVPGDADHVRGTVLPTIQSEVVDPVQAPGTVAVTLGGGDEVFRVVAEQARTDFLRAELIVLPLVGLLLWAVYRRVAPALATLATGVLAVVGALALLRVATTFTEISTFASNIALVMGIGLGVDYGLFMVYRQREELRAGRDVRSATAATVRGAGRTVLFSGVTVAASLAVLLVFPFPFLSSFAYAGVAVVVAAVVAAVVVLPALLVLLGTRVLRRSEAPAPTDRREGRRWARLAGAVMRRPFLAGGGGVVVLLLLGSPALGIAFGAPDDRVLAGDHAVRTMYDTVRTDYTTEEADAVQVVLPDAAPGTSGDDDLAAYAARLSALPGVLRVDAAPGAFVDGTLSASPGPEDAVRFAPPGATTGTWLSVLPTGERLAADPTGLVADVRAVDVPDGLGDRLVGGSPAELTDYRDGVVERLPLVAALIAVV